MDKKEILKKSTKLYYECVDKIKSLGLDLVYTNEGNAITCEPEPLKQITTELWVSHDRNKFYAVVETYNYFDVDEPDEYDYDYEIIEFDGMGDWLEYGFKQHKLCRGFDESSYTLKVTKDQMKIEFDIYQK